MGRGRKTGGPNLVEGAVGSEEAKRRSKAILEVVAGKKTVVEASAELSMGEAMFHRLKTRFIQSGVESLEPRLMGRPAAARPQNAEVEALSERVKELERELKAAEVREEIAVAMPHLKKKRRRGR